MTNTERYRATMEMKPLDRLVRWEHGFMEGTLDLWRSQGFRGNTNDEFCLDFQDPGVTNLGGIGWCEPSLYPAYEEKLLRTEGEYDIAQDLAGRTVRFFHGRRNNFMPTYIKHALASRTDWEEDVKKRLDPNTPQRIKDYDKVVAWTVTEVSRKGNWLSQGVIGQYMYLRALCGPEGAMFAFYDMPDVVEEALDAWLILADSLIARLQAKIELDEIHFAEDICYKNGLLISPAIWRRFLKPRYLELLRRMQNRQRRPLLVNIDTDGNVEEAIPLYLEIGMKMMSPFEIAAGCDVVRIARKYPELRMLGGIDKRILASTTERIDCYLEGIIPFMRQRSGYIPTCDHGVPNEVTLANYRHYRKKMIALGG